MKKVINLNNEKLVDKIFQILTEFKNNPKKIENIFKYLIIMPRKQITILGETYKTQRDFEKYVKKIN